jgi:hypothetical protein
MPFQDAEFREALAPVLAEFGTTVWHCQMFEDNLCYLLALVSENTTPSEGQAFQASWDFHSTKTLGFLVKRLGELVEVLPTDFQDFLRVGVEKRNLIVHGYMTKNATRLFQPKGRLEMVEELQYLRGEIDSRDKAIEQLILVFLEKYGIESSGYLQVIAERLWRQANPEPPHGGDSDPH